jgi:hypothetical protein
MWRGDVVGMKVCLRLSCLSALHNSLFAAALDEHTDNVFCQMVENNREMEFDCDETL